MHSERVVIRSVRAADLIVVLADGGIAARGTLSELLAQGVDLGSDVKAGDEEEQDGELEGGEKNGAEEEKHAEEEEEAEEGEDEDVGFVPTSDAVNKKELTGKEVKQSGAVSKDVYVLVL